MCDYAVLGRNTLFESSSSLVYYWWFEQKLLYPFYDELLEYVEMYILKFYTIYLNILK